MRFNDDGTITLTIDSGDEPIEVTIRRPKLGAYKRLREEVVRSNAKVRAFSEELAKDEPEDAGEKKLWLVDRLVKVNAQTEDVTVAWWVLVLIGNDAFVPLADPPLSSTDDFPAFLSNPDSITKTINHWRSVPLPSGA